MEQRKIKIGLNCRHAYFYEDAKEMDFEEFEVYLKKVSEKAVLIEVRDALDGSLKERFWMPLRFVKLKKEDECWFLYVNFEGYCKWFNRLKNRRGLIGCGSLLVLFEESPYWSYSPIEVRTEKREPQEVDSYLIELGIVDLEEEKREEKPEWEVELEKLLERFGEGGKSS